MLGKIWKYSLTKMQFNYVKGIHRWVVSFLFLGFMVLCTSACNHDDTDTRKGTWVKPSMDYKGRYRKGHYRKGVSTEKNAEKSRAKSRYYYHTKGKYRNKKK